MLGFDSKSCKDLRVNSLDEDEGFSPPDHKGNHPYNANPFNFYDVDYNISDPHNNPGYHALKISYENLAKKVEDLLDKGLSPLETLASLNRSYVVTHEDTESKITNVIKQMKDIFITVLRNYANGK